MRRSAVLCAAALLAAIAIAPSARAQGFSVYEHDACIMARGAAGVAAPCNQASAVFFNPAAIIGGATKWNVQAGVTLIAPTGNFTDSASGGQSTLKKHTFPVPAGYLTYQVSPRLAVGVGGFAPYGLTTDWPTGYPGRYMAYKTTIASIYVQPTVAYAITPGIQIGVGADYVHSSAQVHRRIDASTLPATGQSFTLASLGVPVGTDMGDALFDVSGSGWGGHIGLLIKATDRLSLGARYLSRVKINFTGTATFTPVATGIVLPAGNPFPGVPGGTPLDALLASAFATGGALSKQNATTTITMPDQIVAGLAYKVMSSLSVMADWQHTNWSVFKTLPLNLTIAPSLSEYENFHATDAFRVGLDWQATSRVAIRAGALKHNGASPAETVTPILPEGDRVEATLGAGIELMPRLRLDLAYEYVGQQDRHGRMVDPPAGVTPTAANLSALNSGLFHFTANLFGASLALGF
jgi:long-chain fatty acid transport protein